MQKISIRDYTPETAGKNKIKRKTELKEKIGKEIGKDIIKVRDICKNRDLFIDVCFYLFHDVQTGRSKKDLDNLLKILFDVLSVNMINGQTPIKGLGLIKDDSQIFKIKCEKKIVNGSQNEGLDLIISKR